MRTLILVALVAMLTACGSTSESILEWPSLSSLDVGVEELDSLLASGKTPAELNEQISNVTAQIKTLVKEGVPSGAQNTQMVTEKLSELSSLVDPIQSSEIAVKADALKALHPLVASIMETAGMPHVHSCATCASCATCPDKEKAQDHADHAHADHDHGDHDHDH